VFLRKNKKKKNLKNEKNGSERCCCGEGRGELMGRAYLKG